MKKDLKSQLFRIPWKKYVRNKEEEQRTAVNNRKGTAEVFGTQWKKED